MSRSAFILKIRPGSEEEYRRRHTAVWPELIEALKENGVGNYSIFIQACTLFAYMEIEGDATIQFANLHKHPASIRWREYMSDIIIRDDDNMGFQFLEEVFHLHSSQSLE
jgi:L-rhamnose mutarotase